MIPRRRSAADIGITADRTITIDDRTGVERYPYVLESERPVRALDD